MLNKINLFLNLYPLEEDIFYFILSKEEDTFFRRSKEDIIIKNSTYCFFQILKNNKIYYCTRYNEYIL